MNPGPGRSGISLGSSVTVPPTALKASRRKVRPALARVVVEDVRDVDRRVDGGVASSSMATTSSSLAATCRRNAA